jgi:hypothetical protein
VTLSYSLIVVFNIDVARHLFGILVLLVLGLKPHKSVIDVRATS